MICKSCGTEIADKAIVCFRCGASTSEPKVAPPTGPARRSRIPVVLALLVVAIAALFMSQAAAGETPRLVSWTVAGLALIVLVWQLVQRRR